MTRITPTPKVCPADTNGQKRVKDCENCIPDSERNKAVFCSPSFRLTVWRCPLSARAIPIPIDRGREGLSYQSVLTRLSFYALTISEREVLRAYLIQVRTDRVLLYSSVSTLCDLTRLSRRTVQRAIASLRRRHVLELIQVEDPRHWRGRAYRFHEEKLRMDKRLVRIADRANERNSTGASPWRGGGVTMTPREVKSKTCISKNTGASRSKVCSWHDRAKYFAEKRPWVLEKFSQELASMVRASEGCASNWETDPEKIKQRKRNRAEIAAERTRIPIPIALAWCGFSESECEPGGER